MKHIPDEKQIEELLENSLPIPSSQLEQRLSKAPWTLRAVVHRRLINTTIFAVFSVALLIAVTPQGHTFAQQLFQFFSIAENKYFPIPTDQVLPDPATPTAVPGYILPLETVEPIVDAGQATPLPDLSCESPESASGYYCQVKAAESQAGFNAREFLYAPRGMKFSKVIFDPVINEINMEFVVITGGGYLYLRQGMGDFPSPGDWGKVPAEAVEKVIVHGNYAEQVWESGGPLVLRWREGKHWFSLEKLGDPYPIEWITKEEIIKLAEGLVDDRLVDAVPPLDPEYLKTVEQAETLTGFEVPTPTLLPVGYELKRVVWAENVVRLIYGPENSSDNELFIFMGQIANNRVGPCMECPPGVSETVRIGPWQGWYWRGIFNSTTPIVTGQPTPTPIWEGNASVWNLEWNTDGFWLSMFYSPSYNSGREMNKETLIKIAESLK